MLSIVELCELSLDSMKDADGAPVGRMTAAQTINHIELVSLDICKFVTPHFIGDILEMEAQVIYVDVKKGFAYIQAEAKSVSLDSTASGNSDSAQFEG